MRDFEELRAALVDIGDRVYSVFVSNGKFDIACLEGRGIAVQLGDTFALFTQGNSFIRIQFSTVKNWYTGDDIVTIETDDGLSFDIA